MAENIVELLTDVADAIREKKGTQDKINAQSFADEIRNLPSGASGDIVMKLNNATYNKANVESITLFDSVTQIANDAFADFSAMKSFAITNNVTTIGRGAFWGCASLLEFIIPTLLTDLYNNVFNGCASLVQIEIPQGVNTIGQGVFKNCTSLEKVIVLGTQVKTLYGVDSFQNNASNRFIYVLDNLVESYKSATNWATYADQIKGLSELPNE